jgi:hypothetical protein
MANYSDYPDYVSAASKVQDLNFQLNGAPGSFATGLAGALSDIRNNPKLGPNSEAYKTAKARFDTVQKQLTEAQTNLSTLKTKIDTASKAAGTKKTAAVDAETAKADVTTLTEQLAHQKEINATADEISKTQLALQTAQAKAAGKPQPAIDPTLTTNPDGTTATGDPLMDKFKAYLDTDGISKVSGAAKDAKGNPVVGEFFLVPPIKPGDKPKMMQNVNDAINLMAAGVGGTDKLAKALANAGYTAKDFRTNAIAAIRKYSVDTLDAYQTSKGKLAITGVNSFLADLAKGGGYTTKTRIDQVLTDRAGSDRYIDTYFMDTIGRSANKTEKEAFYKELNKLETTAKTATTTTTDSVGAAKNLTSVGSSITDADRTVLAARFASKTLINTPVDALMKSAKPGQIVSDINSLMQTAADYGINMTTQDALNRLAKGIGDKNYVTKQQDVLKQLSIQLHPTLAAHIQAGGTVKDVADVYARAKATKLGVQVKDSTMDKDVMDAVTKGRTLNDFNMDMQARPEWRLTPEAHNATTDFTNTILSAFGFGG